jgi:predicted transcriptional regulator
MGQFDIKSHEQLREMALPIRTEIVEIVSFLGPCSIRELARYMGRKRPALHFHVARLMEVGLLLEAGATESGSVRAITKQ